MSYIRAPRLHQSTARLWPLRTRISGALGVRGNHRSGWALPARHPNPWSQPAAAYMYSMVPQKVWVTASSWTDSLQSPKSVSLMWPEEDMGGGGQGPPRGAPQPCLQVPTRQVQVHGRGRGARTRTLAVEHDVLGFEVPVDDALGVQVAQGQCDLRQVETAETGQGEGKGRRGAVLGVGGIPAAPPERQEVPPTRLCLPGRCPLAPDA